MNKVDDQALDMPKIFEAMVQKFAEGAVVKKEELAKKLIEAGYNPDNIRIGERILCDEGSFTMRFECFPITTGAKRRT